MVKDLPPGLLLSRTPKAPIVTVHDGIYVVRDDLLPGGTKSRYIPRLFQRVDELVYATPSEGGAQTALAWVSWLLGKKCTVFVAERARVHERVLLSLQLGANVIQVRPGYMTVVHSRAAEYAAWQKSLGRKVLHVEFGLSTDFAVDAIARSARLIKGPPPEEVWFAAGSGVLGRGIAKAWPDAKRFAVQIGRSLTTEEVGGAEIIVYPKRFESRAPRQPPFPSDPHYDAKSWDVCVMERSRRKRVLFWNVAGEPSWLRQHLFGSVG